MRDKVTSMRMNAEESKLLDSFSKLEGLDRAALLRRLLHLGMESYRESTAVMAYAKGTISLSRAAELAGVPLREMLVLLKRYRVELNYDADDLKHDIQTSQSLPRAA